MDTVSFSDFHPPRILFFASPFILKLVGTNLMCFFQGCRNRGFQVVSESFVLGGSGFSTPTPFSEILYVIFIVVELGGGVLEQELELEMSKIGSSGNPAFFTLAFTRHLDPLQLIERIFRKKVSEEVVTRQKAFLVRTQKLSADKAAIGQRLQLNGVIG